MSGPIADLRHRLTLEAPTLAPDDIGGAQENWSVVAELSASIVARTGGEVFTGDRILAGAVFEIRIRYRDDVTTAMRFRRGDRAFQILTALDEAGTRRWLTCRCEEVVP